MSPFKDPEKRKAYARAYGKTYHQQHLEIERKKDREYYWNHRKEIAEKKKLQHQTHKERIARKNAQYKLKNPEKIKAKDLANDHLQIGSSCQICGSTENLVKHHPDYNKPLEVITLCRKHHLETHKKLKEEVEVLGSN